MVYCVSFWSSIDIELKTEILCNLSSFIFHLYMWHLLPLDVTSTAFRCVIYCLYMCHLLKSYLQSAQSSTFRHTLCGNQICSQNYIGSLTAGNRVYSLCSKKLYKIKTKIPQEFLLNILFWLILNSFCIISFSRCRFVKAYKRNDYFASKASKLGCHALAC